MDKIPHHAYIEEDAAKCFVLGPVCTSATVQCSILTCALLIGPLSFELLMPPEAFTQLGLWNILWHESVFRLVNFAVEGQP